MGGGRRLLCTLLVPVVFVAGCTFERRVPVARWVRDPSLPCPQVKEAPRGDPSGALRVEPAADIATAHRPGSPKLWSHYLAYGIETHETARLVVCDLHTGRVTTAAARAEGKSTIFVGHAGSEDVLVYVTQPEMPDALAEDIPWAMATVDLRTGKRRTVAEGTADFLVTPYPNVAWPWIAWAEASDTDATIRTFDLRSGRRRTVATQALVQGNFAAPELDSMVVTEGKVVFRNATGPDGHDLFGVPADGSAPPSRLTTTGRVADWIVHQGRLHWTQRPSPPVVKRWTRSLAGDTEPVQETGPWARDPTIWDKVVAPEAGFVVAQDRKNDVELLAVLDLVSGTRVPVPGSTGFRSAGSFTVADDLIAWTTTESPGPESTHRLHIARVVRE